MAASNKNIRELSEVEFKMTFGKKMTDVTHQEIDPIDIWPYVEKVRKGNSNVDVESVYRNETETFDHVLLPSYSTNEYLVIVVDLMKREVFGHYLLDLKKEYGIQ